VYLLHLDVVEQPHYCFWTSELMKNRHQSYVLCNTGR